MMLTQFSVWPLTLLSLKSLRKAQKMEEREGGHNGWDAKGTMGEKADSDERAQKSG